MLIRISYRARFCHREMVAAGVLLPCLHRSRATEVMSETSVTSSVISRIRA